MMLRPRATAIPWVLGTFAITLATASAAPDSPSNGAAEPPPSPASNLTTDQGGDFPGDPRTDFVCISDTTVETMFYGDVIDDDPFDMYCLAKCRGDHANPGFVPIAGPASPEEILAEVPYVDPFKWCAFVAAKACKKLGSDHELAESCFGSRL